MTDPNDPAMKLLVDELTYLLETADKNMVETIQAINMDAHQGQPCSHLTVVDFGTCLLEAVKRVTEKNDQESFDRR